MQYKNIENILLIILVFLLIIQQSLFTFFDLHIYDKLSKLILVENKYIEFIIITIICFIIFNKRHSDTKKYVSHRCEFPTHVLKNQIPKKANIKLTLNNIPADKIIVYWSLNPVNENLENKNISYDPELTNAGIVKSNNNGKVDLFFRKTDNPYIYYRIEETPGIFGIVHRLLYK